jgi:hemoglobin
MESKAIPTLYGWAGGLERLEDLFKTFYERVPAEPVLAPVLIPKV